MNTKPQRPISEAQKLIDEAFARGEDRVVLPTGSYCNDGTGPLRVPANFTVVGTPAPETA